MPRGFDFDLDVTPRWFTTPGISILTSRRCMTLLMILSEILFYYQLIPKLTRKYIVCSYRYITYIPMSSFSLGTGQSLDTLDGVTKTENAVQFDLTAYSMFIEIVADVEVADDFSDKEYYRVRNRLEAFIHDAKHYDIWTPVLLEAYPDVDSLAEVTALARALRQYEQQCNL